MLNFLQNGRCCFTSTTLLMHTTTLAISTKNSFLYFSQFSTSDSTLTCSQNHKMILTIPTNISLFLRITISTIYTKNIFPTSAIQPTQTDSREQGPRESYKDRLSFNLFLLPQRMYSHNRESQPLIPYRPGLENWCIAGSSHWWRCLQSKW